MKYTSSKRQVKDHLDILSKVHKVSVPSEIFETIRMKIDEKRKNTVSFSWIRSAAAALFLLIAFETYLVTSRTLSASKENTATVQSIVPETNNLLYND